VYWASVGSSYLWLYIILRITRNKYLPIEETRKENLFQLIKFNALPGSAPEGGLAISANNFYVGL